MDRSLYVQECSLNRVMNRTTKSQIQTAIVEQPGRIVCGLGLGGDDFQSSVSGTRTSVHEHFAIFRSTTREACRRCRAKTERMPGPHAELARATRGKRLAMDARCPRSWAPQDELGSID